MPSKQGLVSTYKTLYVDRMERKPIKRERKMPGGIALKPSLWRRIELVAETRGTSKNEIMEEVLAANVPYVPDFPELIDDRPD